MARVVTERIHAWESLLDPSRYQVDRQRESVHLDKSAIMKAEKPLKVCQSRLFLGLKK